MMGWNDGVGWRNGMGWGGWFGMAIFMILFWGLVIWGIVALVRYVNVPGQQASAATRTYKVPASSDEILAMRFARGEIDEEEYTRRTTVLQSLHEASASARSPKAAHDDRTVA